jgi:hypothetical protein
MTPHLVDAQGMAPPPGSLLVGWKEYLDFPEWGLHHVRVKIDTGAWNSALDVASYEIEQGEKGPIARLRLIIHRSQPDRVLEVQAPVLRTTVVCNPSGRRECRPVLETLVRLGPLVRRIRLTVTDRSHMRHRMILGRQALAGTFVVDASRKYLLRSCKG